MEKSWNHVFEFLWEPCSKDKRIVFSIFTEVLSADRVLASEIEFDLQKFEEQQAELARQRKAPSSVQVLEK